MKLHGVVLIILIPSLVFSNERGQQLYKNVCIACHAPSNIMVSSPKLGDKKDWNKRLEEKKGLKNLILSAEKGINAMPAKGTCTTCTTEDLKSAILYMMDEK